MSTVIGINGSPRKDRNSAVMLEHALKGASSVGADIERIDLAELSFSGCTSCFACKRRQGGSLGRCAVRDELSAVLDRILAADAVIISAPIYFGDVPGMVRNLFERIWFPGLLYSGKGAIAYKKRVRVGLIYTMGASDPDYYKELIGLHTGTFKTFLGETSAVTTCDTWQFDDYSLYVGDFNMDAKERARDAAFPEDCRKAFAMGADLVGGRV